jgi:hypothetical protein
LSVQNDQQVVVFFVLLNFTDLFPPFLQVLQSRFRQLSFPQNVLEGASHEFQFQKAFDNARLPFDGSQVTGQFETQQLVSKGNETKIKLLDFYLFINSHSFELFFTQVIDSRRKVNKVLFPDKGGLVVQDDGGNGAHGLGFGVNEEDDSGCGISVDGFGVVDKLINFRDDGGSLELEVEDEVDGVEDLIVSVKAFGGWEVVELVLDAGF